MLLETALTAAFVGLSVISAILAYFFVPRIKTPQLELNGEQKKEQDVPPNNSPNVNQAPPPEPEPVPPKPVKEEEEKEDKDVGKTSDHSGKSEEYFSQLFKEKYFSKVPESERQVANELVYKMKLSKVKILAGHEIVGKKTISITTKEVGYPTDNFDIRKIRDLSEIHMLIPSEELFSDDIKWARILSGEALVKVFIEEEVEWEHVYAERWETKVNTMTVMLDVSPSMMIEHSRYKIFAWRALLVMIISRAMTEKIPLYIVPFGNVIFQHSPVVINSFKSAVLFLQCYWDGQTMLNGTDIDKSIRQTLRFFKNTQADNNDFIIITDAEAGEVGADLPEKLEELRVNMHSICIVDKTCIQETIAEQLSKISKTVATLSVDVDTLNNRKLYFV